MNNSLGETGEKVTAFFLEKKGYQVLQRNFHAQGGEIDLICTDKTGKLVFVEVKTRTSTAFGDAKSSVSEQKFQKILKAIEAYLAKEFSNEETPEFQIDVVAVRKNKDKWFCEHIPNIGPDDF